MKKIKWISSERYKKTDLDHRVFESEWEIPMNKIGGKNRVKIFCALDAAGYQGKAKPGFYKYLCVSEEDMSDSDKLNEEIKHCIEEVGRACDYYEKHGHFEDDKPDKS